MTLKNGARGSFCDLRSDHLLEIWISAFRVSNLSCRFIALYDECNLPLYNPSPSRHYYILTYSTERSPSWEGNRFLASQERFSTVVTSTHHLSVYWVTSIQSRPPQPTSWRSILTLSSHLCLGLPSVSLREENPEPCVHLSSSPYMLHAPPISFFSIWSLEQYWVRSTDH